MLLSFETELRPPEGVLVAVVEHHGVGAGVGDLVDARLHVLSTVRMLHLHFTSHLNNRETTKSVFSF